MVQSESEKKDYYLYRPSIPVIKVIDSQTLRAAVIPVNHIVTVVEYTIQENETETAKITVFLTYGVSHELEGDAMLDFLEKWNSIITEIKPDYEKLAGHPEGE